MQSTLTQITDTGRLLKLVPFVSKIPYYKLHPKDIQFQRPLLIPSYFSAHKKKMLCILHIMLQMRLRQLICLDRRTNPLEQQTMLSGENHIIQIAGFCK